MLKVFCDICEKEIAGEEINKVGFGHIEANGYTLAKTETDIEDDMHFCPDCVKRIADAIRDRSIWKEKPPKRQKEKPAQAKAEEAETPSRKRSDIDRGKVWALKDAGWKVSAIAKEMYTSQATVYKVLKEGRPEIQRAG